MCSLKRWKRNEKLRRKGNEKEAEKERRVRKTTGNKNKMENEEKATEKKGRKV